MRVIIDITPTKEQSDKISEILGCEVELIYKRPCIPLEALIADIVIRADTKDLPYGGLFKRPLDVTNEQITAIVNALTGQDAWSDFTAVWEDYIAELNRVISQSRPKIIKVSLAVRENAEENFGVVFNKTLGSAVHIMYHKECTPEACREFDPDLIMTGPGVNNSPWAIVHKKPEWITTAELKMLAEKLGSTNGTYVDQCEEWHKLVLNSIRNS